MAADVNYCLLLFISFRHFLPALAHLNFMIVSKYPDAKKFKRLKVFHK